MTTPDKQRRTDPIEVAESPHDVLPSGAITSRPFQGSDVSSELRFLALGRAPADHRCPTCDDLERGRRQAAAARDPSKVTDFDVLIARHRARHGAGS
ncbi:hypothetical protein ACFY0Z_30320 [Streptomyces kronopolitis]|uniref:hypothetical protein n=1 Tax=Streptomyces kronopolitis TaxID=1612435 RepID=UPI0036A6F81B